VIFLRQGDFTHTRMGPEIKHRRVDNKKSGCRLGKKHGIKYRLIFCCSYAMGADKLTLPHGHPSRSPFLFFTLGMTLEKY
jgi:hypothetical protein